MRPGNTWTSSVACAHVRQLAAHVQSFVWGGVLAVLDPNPSPNGIGDGGLGAYVLIVGAFALGAASKALWKLCHAHLWPRRDPGDDAGLVVMVVWYGAVAAFVAVVVLRVTDVF